MFTINGNDIYINRGDTATFTVTPYEDSGEQHEMEEHEYLRMTVRPQYNSHELWHIDSQPGYTQFDIAGPLTQRMKGRYDYDVKLMYPDGTQATIIGATQNFMPHFVVLEG